MSIANLKASAKLTIRKPVHDVFEAIVDPALMSNYFISHGDARLATGKQARWRFDAVSEEADAAITIEVEQVATDHRIRFFWPVQGSRTYVEIDLEPIEDGNSAELSVIETGWPADAEGIAHMAQQTRGWVHFLCSLKAFVEYGVSLRDGTSIGPADTA